MINILLSPLIRSCGLHKLLATSFSFEFKHCFGWGYTVIHYSTCFPVGPKANLNNCNMKQMKFRNLAPKFWHIWFSFRLILKLKNVSFSHPGGVGALRHVKYGSIKVFIYLQRSFMPTHIVTFSGNFNYVVCLFVAFVCLLREFPLGW